MRSRRRVSDGQLQKLVRRLLGTNRRNEDTPVVISTLEGTYCASVGKLLERAGARVKALVDTALVAESAVTVFS